jgi:phosphomannomutase
MKRLIIFDLDGTLAESKLPLDAEMATLLARLLEFVKVAVISGGAWPQFEKQVLHNLPDDKRLKDLSILPTCGTKFYRYDGAWQELYSEDFSVDEKKRIIGGLNKAIDQSGFRAEKHWGDLVEDRGSQIYIFRAGPRGAARREEEMGFGLQQAQEDQGNSRASNSRIFHSIGRRDIDRCHQVGH